MSLAKGAVPMNFGVWSGQGYAAGQFDPDMEAFVRFYDKDSQDYVRPLGFLDAAARNHDLAYEYAERAYGEKSASPNKEMYQQTRFLADLDLMANALQYRPDDFIGKHYRDMMIKGFYYLAVREYGMGAHMERLWKDYLSAYDPGYPQPKLSDLPILGRLGDIMFLPDIDKANMWGLSGLEMLTTSDFLTDAQRQANWLEGESQSPDDGVTEAANDNIWRISA